MVKRAAAPKVTRKHVARAEHERRQRNVILGAALAVTIVVSGLLIYGVLGNLITPVATVNGEKLPTGEFRGRIRLAQAEMINQAIFSDTVDQLPARLADVETLGQNVLNQMIDDALIRQEVERRGETITEDEIDDAIAEAFGFYPDGTPTPFPTFTPNPTALALASITPTVTEGPTPTDSPTNTPGPSPTATATYTPIPTATEYTEEAYLENFDLTLDGLDTQFNVTEEDFRGQFQAQLYRRKLFEFFEDEVPRDQEHVNARHILVDDEETALEVLQRLADEESFEDLAIEYSKDETNKERGGDLGWFPRGFMVQTFEDAVFNAEIGLIPDPVETSFGWHVLEVVGRENRELDEYSHQLAVQTEYNNWLIDIHLLSAIEINKNWLDRVPDPPSLGSLVPPSP
ncbi:MAG: peptidylprolyl isomerase [Anaerolineales bacterium]|nr:peptidylprolyl isomerase [Anaerolineales bacterium]